MTQPTAQATKPDCYKCIHRGANPGTAHIRCNHPSNQAAHSPAPAAMAILASIGRIPPFQIKTALTVKGHPTGLLRGWFNWPYNFDPTWLLECDGFEAKDAK